MGLPREYTNVDQRRISVSRTEVTEGLLRTMWSDGEFTRSPQGWAFTEQLDREHPDLVRCLSYETPLDGGEAAVASLRTVLSSLWEAWDSWLVRDTPQSLEEAWQSLSEEEKGWIGMATVCGRWWAEWPGVPRVTTGVKNRVNRLRALGNGIVPAVVREFLLG